MSLSPLHLAGCFLQSIWNGNVYVLCWSWARTLAYNRDWSLPQQAFVVRKMRRLLEDKAIIQQ